MPSGVSESRPLIACRMPTRSSPRTSGHEFEAVLHLELEVLLRERELGRRQGRLRDRRDVVGVHEDRSVGVRADLQVASVLALVHVGVHVPDDRERDLADGLGQLGTGPTLIIWWTAGVSGIDAPAIFAIRGLQTPQHDHDRVCLDRPRVGPDAADAAVVDIDAGRPRSRPRPSARRAPGRARA